MPPDPLQLVCISGIRVLPPAPVENRRASTPPGARHAPALRVRRGATLVGCARRSIVCLAPPILFALAFCSWPLPVAARPEPSSPPSRPAQFSFDSSGTVELAGNRVPWANAAFDLGPVPPALLRSRMLLLLKRTPLQDADLQALLRAQQDVRSPQYHRWLTPEQFGARFGPPQEDIDRVIAWLRSQGISVAGVSRGRQAIEFSATAGQIRQAFATDLHRFRVGGKTVVANASPPRVPLALQSLIAGFDGLHDSRKQSYARLAELWPPEIPFRYPGPDLAVGAQQYLAPGDFWTIYNVTPVINAGVTGSGVTIGIAGRSDISSDDVARFRADFLTPSYTGKFQQFANGADPGTIPGDDVEDTLDAEWAGALAPDADVLLVVSASNGADGVDLSAQYLVDNNLADVISVSFGLCEELLGASENQFFAALWQQAAAQGITVAVAAGDNGSAGCDDASNGEAVNGLEVNGLASTPFNIAVGGTEFHNDTGAWASQTGSYPLPGTSALGYIPEQAWNESHANGTLWAGSGGSSNCITLNVPLDVTGCSGGWPKPDWQTPVYGVPTDSARDVPDVSFAAAVHNGYNISIGGVTETVGGTSASTPAFAGVMALFNQKMPGRLGLANTMLYQLAASQYGDTGSPGNLTGCDSAAPSENACLFYDVTIGTNAVPCAAGTLNCAPSLSGSAGLLIGFNSGAGYDLATGLGSINVANLLQAWFNATPHSAAAATTTALTASPASVMLGQPTTLSAQIASSFGTPAGTVSFSVGSKPLGSASVTSGIATLANTSVIPANGFIAGSNTIAAAFSGNANFAPSSATALLAAVVPQTASPTFSPAPGLYSAPQTVAISDPTPGASIYYTSDGSSPSTQSPAYSVPITIAASTTLTAIAVAACCRPSAAASAAYTIALPPQPAFISRLTPFSVHAGGAAFTLTVDGSGFDSNSVVFWESSALPTQMLTATKLQAHVPAAAIANPGVFTVAIRDAATVSNSLQFEVDSPSSPTPPPTLLPATATVVASSIATYPVILPSGVSIVAAACLNLPADAQCSFSPAANAVALATAASTPRGAYQVTVVFTETVSVSLAAFAPFFIALLALVRARRRFNRFVSTALLLVVALLFAASLGSCGGVAAGPGSPVTRELTSSAAVNLIVQ